MILELLESLTALSFFILRVRPNALASSPEEDKWAEFGQVLGYNPALTQKWDQCLHAFAAACPPLEFIALDIVGLRPTHVRVTRTEEGFALEYLSTEEGAAIIEEEDMEWCRRPPFPHSPRYRPDSLLPDVED